MPRSEGRGSSEQFAENALVKALRPDPSERPIEYHLIRGWVGRSTMGDMFRLYPSPELDEYIEIDSVDLLYQVSLDREGNALGGSIIAVRADAELKSMGSETVTARAAAMLDGGLMRQFVATSDPAQLAAAYRSAGPLNDKDYTKGFWCNVSMFFSCTTHVVDDPVCTTASGKLCGTARYLP
jgi:hypothetical protein